MHTCKLRHRGMHACTHSTMRHIAARQLHTVPDWSHTHTHDHRWLYTNTCNASVCACGHDKTPLCPPHSWPRCLQLKHTCPDMQWNTHVSTVFTVNHATYRKLPTDTKGDGKCCTDMQTGTCTVHVHRCLHMWGRLGSTVLHGNGHQVAAVTKLWINYSTAARAMTTHMPNETTLGVVPMDLSYKCLYVDGKIIISAENRTN